MSGIIPGLTMTRNRRHRLMVTGVMVRLDDGREVRAVFDLQPMPYIGKKYFHLGWAATLATDEGDEPYEIVDLNPPA
jgi:hypothetical protein